MLNRCEISEIEFNCRTWDRVYLKFHRHLMDVVSMSSILNTLLLLSIIKDNKQESHVFEITYIWTKSESLMEDGTPSVVYDDELNLLTYMLYIK